MAVLLWERDGCYPLTPYIISLKNSSLIFELTRYEGDKGLKIMKKNKRYYHWNGTYFFNSALTLWVRQIFLLEISGEVMKN